MATISWKSLLCLLFLTITLLLGIFYDTFNTPFPTWRPPCVCCDGKVTTDTITPLGDNRTFIISPYFDNRTSHKPAVRVLSIIHYTEVKELYCLFCCTVKKSVEVSKAEISAHRDRFGFPYVTANLVCTMPPDCQAKYLTVHTSPNVTNMSQLPLFPIRNQDVQSFSANFTVCISIMYGNYRNVLQFIQTIEMYRILGAQRVLIYLNNCSSQVQKVMQYYEEEGVLEVIPWPINHYLKTSKAWHYSKEPNDIGYYGQLVTLNDCIYQSMYRSKFVLLNDIDEIILPLKHQTWDSLMESLQEQNPGVGVFLFENRVFPITAATDGNFSDITSWKSLPGFDILQHIHREPDRKGYTNPRKLIVDPRKVFQTSVHYVAKEIGGSRIVSPNTASLYHCKTPAQKNLTITSLIEDKTIWRYNVSLIRNVNKVVNQINL